MKNYVIVLKTDEDGKTCIKIVPMSKEQLELEDMYKLCECRCISIADPVVEISNIKFDYEMIFDEEFLLKEDVIANPLASYLYGYSAHKECLCGNVIIAKKVLIEDDMCSAGFSEKESLQILNVLGQIAFITSEMDFQVQEPCIRFIEFQKGDIENEFGLHRRQACQRAT